MGICVPKHIVCNWYNPGIGSPPNFVAGSESCVLKTVEAETRARLAAGGTFFRSIALDNEANNIQVTCKWQVSTGGSPEWEDYQDGIHTHVDRVKLTIESGSPALLVETFYAEQVSTGSPMVWTSNAIPTLRDKLNGLGSPNGSVLITMPNKDVQQPWYNMDSPAGSPPTRDADHILEFGPSNLSGGETTTFSLNDIRTGPAFTMLYFNTTERDSDIGELTSAIRYWNGACWKGYNPSSPDCIDPSVLGSPNGLSCELGPSSDC